MPAAHLNKGEQAERLAEQQVIAAGFDIVARNVHSRFGEIDLIAQKNNLLVFIEVRFRSNSQFGSALESVSVQKQRKVIKAAQYFLANNSSLNKLHMRFDVIGIDAQNRVQWIEGAFQTS